MPLGEIETHPFLNLQLGPNINAIQLHHFTKMIVGTFPIYAITNSNPVAQAGINKRLNWTSSAFFQYFYGSLDNHFWELFSNSFIVPKPNTVINAITMLNNNHFIITDVIQDTQRIDYSSADKDLRNFTLNQLQIPNILNQSENLKIIYFTSQKAKELFCKAVGIIYNSSIDYHQNIFGKNYRLIELPLKLRQVQRFFINFPLTPTRMQKGYAKIYAQRYYSHYLSL